MSNIFLDKRTENVKMRVLGLYYSLKDYKDAFPDEPYIHEAWLQVMDKLYDLGVEV